MTLTVKIVPEAEWTEEDRKVVEEILKWATEWSEPTTTEPEPEKQP